VQVSLSLQPRMTLLVLIIVHNILYFLKWYLIKFI
jgi:hypothetical protein